MLTGGGGPRIVFFGTYDTAMHPRVAVLAEGLRARGAAVAECNAPLGIGTAERVAAVRQPWRAVPLAARLARRWWTLARSARRFGRPEVVVVGYLGLLDVHLARLVFGKTRLVLDHLASAAGIAADRALGGRLRRAMLSTVDRAALARADVVVVDTDEQRAALPAPGKAVVCPVGAPAAWFAAGETTQTPADAPAARSTAADATPKPAGDAKPDAKAIASALRVVFFGLYTPLQGAPVIGAAAGLLAGRPVRFTMVGGGQDEAATRRAAGGAAVEWLPWVAAGELPALVAAHDVCLGIFGTGPKAARVVPNKVFQGAAAGCAIVTSGTGPQRRALGDAAVFVPPGDPDALAATLLWLAGDRAELDRRRAAARALAEERFTAERVVEALWERIARA
ncbi:glycosyltransferase [Dactylosporangium sp. CS-033363]|uniref:glycosyltransferase n=1 Tax=Dactylosporangium sp. CS-033363 TaxID=3239935 RepID=UPI003D8A67BE